MGSGRKRWWGWLLAGLAAAAGGCTKQDKARLARVGGRLTAKIDDAAAERQGKLGKGWQPLRFNWGDAAVDARVSARLRWDKALAGSAIQVRSQGEGVELRGTVRDQTQRQRAVHLANTTAGVDRVIDMLEVSLGR